MGTVIVFPDDQTRASSTSRAAKVVSKSAVTPASRARSVASSADQYSAGMLLRWNHFVTIPPVAPISEASASLAPCASLGPHSSMIARNEVREDAEVAAKSVMPTPLGQIVLKGKSVLSLDCGRPLGQTVRMAESDAEVEYKQSFIERVRLARTSTGMKQWQIALAMDVPQDHYKHWERSRLIPHHLIPRFCFATHVEPAWLLTGHGRMKGTPGPEIVRAPAAPAIAPRRPSKRKARSVA